MDINNRKFTEIINDSYSRYANYVVQDRALPYISDGFKPVQRRILWTGYVQGYKPNGGFRKSGAWVNTTMGDYHAHGDSSIYQSSGNMTAPWTRVPLITGRGNFGFTFGDSFGHPRYTEQKMSEVGWSLMEGVKENAVDMVNNYDNTKKEPVYLPVSIPVLAINGTEGIAVGFACKFPQHNPVEIMDLCIELLGNENLTTEEMLTIVPGPDWKTGGEVFIQDKDGNSLVKEYFETGQAKLTVRAKAHVNKNKIIITELPYGSTEEKVRSGIKGLLLNGKIDGPHKVEILSGKKNGLEVEISVRKGYSPQQVLEQLYSISGSGLTETFSVNMNAISRDGEPRMFNFKEVLLEFLETRKDATRRVYEFRLQKAQDRLHLLDGMMKIVLDIDKAISIIRNSDNVKAARKALIDHFKIDEIQANYVLAMQLSRLTKQDSHEIEKESNSLEKEIDDIQGILSSPIRMKNIVKKQLKDARKMVEPYGQRYTEINDQKANTITKSSQSRSLPKGNWGIDGVGYLSNTGVNISDGKNTAFAVLKSGKIKIFNGKGLPGTHRAIPIVPESEMEDLVYAGAFTKHEDIYIITTEGKILRLDPSAINSQGIAGSGVAGIKLNDAQIAGVLTAREDDNILTISDGGCWKVTPAKDIPRKGRGSQGVYVHRLKRGEKSVIETAVAKNFKVGDDILEPTAVIKSTKQQDIKSWSSE